MSLHVDTNNDNSLQADAGNLSVSQPLLAGCPRHIIMSVAVILFAVFSFGGWVYETVDNIFRYGCVYLRASLFLPWCPIYGIGGLIIIAVLDPARRWLATHVPLAVQVLLIAVGIYLLTAAVELAGSYVCEALMGFVPWDYSEAWMNFQGRIAPAYTMKFVALGLLALYVLYPCISKWAKANRRGAVILACVLATLFVLDCILEALGIWAPVKDALLPYGINHW